MNCRSALRQISVAFAFALAAAFLAPAQQAAPKNPDTDRLIQTAKVWIAVKYFHPYAAYHAVDWDKALVEELPNIRSAKSVDEYKAALQSLLKPVNGLVLRDNQGAGGGVYDDSSPRTWIHHGFPPESGPDPGIFYSVFTSQAPHIAILPTTIPLGDGLQAQVNLFDYASPAGIDPKPDSYPSDRYPSTEYRILAAYKTWGVIHHFFAYRDLMDEDWDDVFASFLPKFIAAKDAREYNLTVADMLTHTLDSQVSAVSDELSDYFGRASVGLRLRLIEQKPVIIEILDEQAKTQGIRVGDIVASIDGQKIADRFNRVQDYTPGGTPQRRGFDSLQRVLNGADASTAALIVGTQDGANKEVKLQRTVAFAQGLHHENHPGEALRILPENIGYVDLTRVTDAKAIFDKLQNTTAIIFDARGNLSPEAKYIASHLTSASDVAGAIITGPITLSPDIATTRSLTSTASYFFVEKVPEEAQPKYTGQTVMLIDERTISNAEHLGLWLEAANNTTFVGTPSAGADGLTSNFVLPGGIIVSFSGQDVRHGNTGKLQRLGLQPNVLVAPTVNGIRHGRDEVLERAINVLTNSDEHRTRARNNLPIKQLP